MKNARKLTRMSKLLLMLLFTIASLCGTAVGQHVATFSSYHAGKRYDFPITHEQIARTPVWLDDADNPPLSVRQARTVAMEQLKTLFPNADHWTLSKIAL